MKNIILSVAVMAFVALPGFAKIQLGSPFSDHAVFQREMEVPVWGTAEPGRQITVEFADAKRATIAGSDGKWQVKLPKMAASKEGRTMTVVESEIGWLFNADVETVEVDDILVGEVWFASGQSNMECPIWGGGVRYRDGAGGLLTTMTQLPFIRFAKNAHQWTVEPTRAKCAGWKRFVPEDLKDAHLSAVAFYYARELYLALDVPIGIVDSSWGGTNIETWIPRRGFEGGDPSLAPIANYQLKKRWDKAKDKQGSIVAEHKQPTVLFNGMVSSWTPMAMRGFIWYQGCSNSADGDAYRVKMHALYDGWAKAFANPDLKLYFVQLAPFRTNWLGICAAQDRFAAEEENAEIAVTADVGNFDDIHPNNKEIVSKRLAVHALKRAYGLKIEQDRSPVLKAATFEGDTAKLAFDNVKSWYVYAPDCRIVPPFELAGADGVWQPATMLNETDVKTGVKGDVLLLRSDKVAKPTKVRYMGQPKTAGILYNEASLPLGPFVKE